ncbi:unnamed protein product [Arabidopsis halleri]
MKQPSLCCASTFENRLFLSSSFFLRRCETFETR